MPRTASPFTALAKHLAARSREICRDNGCKRDEDHRCESYAYITESGTLLDLCASDYFQGSSTPHAAIPLPWNGSGRDLKQAVEQDLPID